MIEKLRSLLELVRVYLFMLEDLPELLEDYPTLIKLVEEEELITQFSHLQAMIGLIDVALIKNEFTRLCQFREGQNRLTLLDFIASPNNYCNLVYLDFAKILYPEASFQTIFRLVYPSITNQLSVNICIGIDRSNSKRRKTESIELTQQRIEEPTSYLAELAVEPSTFNRLIIVNQTVFVLDEIIRFDFHLHQQLFEQLKEHYPEFLQALVIHNHELSKLYHAIRRVSSEGTTLYLVFSQLVEKMRLSGVSGGSGIYASEQGFLFAHQLLNYYENLPEILKTRLAQCRHAEGYSFETVMTNIRSGECIETISSRTLGILQEPANREVLTVSLNLNDEERKTLTSPYLCFKSGTPIIDINGTKSVIELPMDLCSPLYHMIDISTLNQWLHYLVYFPSEVYLQLLNETNFNLELISNLDRVLSALDVQRRSALVSALLKANIPPVFLVSPLISADEIEAAGVLIDSLSKVQYIALLSATDSSGRTFINLSLYYPALISLFLRLLVKEGREIDYHNVLIGVNQRGRSHLDALMCNPDAFKVFLIYLENTEDKSAVTLRKSITIAEWCDILLRESSIQAGLYTGLFLQTTPKFLDNFSRLLTLYPELYKVLPLEAWYAPFLIEMGQSFQNTSPFYYLSKSLIGQKILVQLFKSQPTLFKIIPPKIWCQARPTLNDENSNTSPLYWLCFNQDCEGILLKRLKETPSLFTKKLLKYWYVPHLTKQDDFENTSPLYWLAASAKGRFILLMLLDIKPKVFLDIPVKAWFLTCTAEKGPHKYASPFFWLCAHPSGLRILQKLLILKPEFFKNIPVSALLLSPSIEVQDLEYKPSIWLLTQSPHGRELLFVILKHALLMNSELLKQLPSDFICRLQNAAPDIMKRIAMLAKALASEANRIVIEPVSNPNSFFHWVPETVLLEDDVGMELTPSI